MRNIKLTIEYDGTDHAGWQAQNINESRTADRKSKTRSIQETIEGALYKILQEKVRVVSSGRTDSGVHAQAQVANFKSATRLPCQSILKALNSSLPAEISVTGAEDVKPGFHARFSAKSKLYRYTILNRQARSPFARLYAYHVPYKLDVSAMKKAAKSFVGKKDFKSFQAKDKINRPSVRTIKNISVRKSGDFICIDVEANGFLYKMVRNIAGTLIEVGRGEISPNEVKSIIKSADRKGSGPTAKAKGLSLIKVNY